MTQSTQPTNPANSGGWYYYLEDRAVNEVSDFVRRHWYCFASSALLYYSLGRYSITRAFRYEGTIIGSVCMFSASLFWRGGSPNSTSEDTNKTVPIYPNRIPYGHGGSQPQQSTPPKAVNVTGMGNKLEGEQLTVVPQPNPPPVVKQPPTAKSKIEATAALGPEIRSKELQRQLDSLQGRLDLFSRLLNDRALEWSWCGSLRTSIRDANQSALAAKATLEKLKQKYGGSNSTCVTPATEEEISELAYVLDKITQITEVYDFARQAFPKDNSERIAKLESALMTQNIRTIDVGSDGNCGWACVALFLELAADREMLDKIPTDHKFTAKPQTAPLQKEVAELSRQLALSDEQIGQSTPKEKLQDSLRELCVQASSSGLADPDAWLAEKLIGKSSDEIEAFVMSEEADAGWRLLLANSPQWQEALQEDFKEIYRLAKGTDLLERVGQDLREKVRAFAKKDQQVEASNYFRTQEAMEAYVSTYRPNKTWKEHLQTRLQQLWENKNNDERRGIPDFLERKLQSLGRDSVAAQNFIMSEKKGEGWQLYVEAQGTPGLWATSLEFYLMCRKKGLRDIQWAALGEEGLKWHSATFNTCGDRSLRQNQGVIHIFQRPGHYNLLITSQDAARLGHEPEPLPDAFVPPVKPLIPREGTSTPYYGWDTSSWCGVESETFGLPIGPDISVPIFI